MAKRRSSKVSHVPSARSARDSEVVEGSGQADVILGTPDVSLLDVVDNVLNKGVVLSGDVTIGLAHVDLIYARLSLLLCAADRVLPSEDSDFMKRHHQRHMMRIARRVARDLARRGAKR
jgi:hypothetical protein